MCNVQITLVTVENQPVIAYIIFINYTGNIILLQIKY